MTDQILDANLSDPSGTDNTDRPEQVEVRRNVVLSAIVGTVAVVLTVAFAARGFADGKPLDWALFAVLGAITVLHLAAVADGRAPLLVADRLGVRLRHGAHWQGIAWEQIDCLEHLPRRLPLHDGHLLVVGEDGQQLIVPLSLATRVVGAAPEAISDELAALADGRADVVEVVPGLVEEEAEDVAAPTEAVSSESDPDPSAPLAIGPLPEDTVRLQRRGIAAEVERRFRTPLDRTANSDESDTVDTADTLEPVDADDSTDEFEPVTDGGTGGPSPAPGPGRPVIAPARVEVQRTGFRGGGDGGTGSHPTIGANALRAEPTPAPDEVEHTLTVVLDDLAVQPAAEPAIGPQLEASRERLRLTVDQLSERTRIRPHVIEAIEVDDFGPCGGDFYARGHLRTLARVLGIDAGPLIASYDELYADAPVDPRRIFESELATGVGGSIRGTRGGRNWSVLVAAVMAAVLIWSIARLVMDGPVTMAEPSTLRETGSGGIGGQGAGKVEEVPVTLTATGGGARVIVRDGQGDEVFDEPLAFGQTAKLDVEPPVRIWTSDGSVTASVDCKDPMPLGETGAEASKSLPAC